MPTYNSGAVSNAAIAHRKGISLQTGRALRDNPIAIVEGEAGAPRIQFAAMDAWFTTYGAIGSYVFGLRLSPVVAGDAYAGSSIVPASVGGLTPTAEQGSGSPALAGQWRAMGAGSFTGAAPTVLTLFVRIS